MFFCFCIIYQQFAACLSSLCLVSICLLLCMENRSLLSQKKLMACTSHVSHPFDSVHVLFVALYCVKSQETYRVKRVSFHADLQLRNGVKGRTRALAFYTQTPLAFGSARVRIRRVLNSQLPRLRQQHPISYFRGTTNLQNTVYSQLCQLTCNTLYSSTLFWCDHTFPKSPNSIYPS